MTKRLTPKELAEIQYAGMAKIALGKQYRHIKSGAEYLTIACCLNEADLVPLVIYIPQETEGLGLTLSFARPVDEFLERFKRD